MPYFVYKIAVDQDLEMVRACASYPEAKALCTEMRKARTTADRYDVRMVFAEDTRQAKRLLTERRQAATPLEEWEA